MGSIGGSKSTPQVQAADAIVAATAKEANSDSANNSAEAQRRARQLRKGISSTYSRYEGGSGSAKTKTGE